MGKKRRKTILIVSAAILVPTIIAGSVYLGVSKSGGDRSRAIDDSILENSKDPIDGKIEIENSTLDLYSKNQSDFIQNIKQKLTNNYKLSTGIDFMKFEIKGLKQVQGDNNWTFTASESVFYGKTYDFKMHLKNIDELIKSDTELNNIFNFDENNYESIKVILDKDELYQNIESKRMVNNLYQNKKINLKFRLDDKWTDKKTKKYFAEMSFNNNQGAAEFSLISTNK